MFAPPGAVIPGGANVGKEESVCLKGVGKRVMERKGLENVLQYVFKGVGKCVGKERIEKGALLS